MALAAVTVTAFVEELLFRGVLQALFGRVAGRAGLLAPTALLAVTHADSGSIALDADDGARGAAVRVRGALDRATGGPSGGHTLLSVGAGVLLPAVLRRRAPETVSVLATITALVAFAIFVPLAVGYVLRQGSLVVAEDSARGGALCTTVTPKVDGYQTETRPASICPEAWRSLRRTPANVDGSPSYPKTLQAK
jgi:membrane protease YdiL (CAAX protease family)